jgi:hypothetical protein
MARTPRTLAATSRITYDRMMDRNQTFRVVIILFALSALIIQGCSGGESRNSSLRIKPGQDVIVNYAIDVQTRKYSTGKFVSMDDHWITISKSNPIDADDQRKWHASFNLDRVYLIQSAQNRSIPK